MWTLKNPKKAAVERVEIFSGEFAKWCGEMLKKYLSSNTSRMNLIDVDISILKYCSTLTTNAEIREILRDNLVNHLIICDREAVQMYQILLENLLQEKQH